MNKSPFKNSMDNKRYYTLNYYNRRTYGKKIYKAVIDCNFTCPNKDGSKGYGGCIFCDGGSGYFTQSGVSITEQLEKEAERIFKKYGKVPINAYFQANTNTYAPIEILRDYYYQAVNFSNVEGISIGTRADCLSDDILDLLTEINKKTNLTIELGMQTIHEETLKYINRCCTHKDFEKGYYKLKERGIRVCLHIINGLPFENTAMMEETALRTAELHPDAVKLQMLHVIRNTKLAEDYNKGIFHTLTMDEYIDIIIRQLEILPPDTVIERITGDGDKSKLIAPVWSANKISVLGEIDKALAKKDTWQGKLYSIKNEVKT